MLLLGALLLPLAALLWWLLLLLVLRLLLLLLLRFFVAPATRRGSTALDTVDAEQVVIAKRAVQAHQFHLRPSGGGRHGARASVRQVWDNGS